MSSEHRIISQQSRLPVLSSSHIQKNQVQRIAPELKDPIRIEQEKKLIEQENYDPNKVPESRSMSDNQIIEFLSTGQEMRELKERYNATPDDYRKTQEIYSQLPVNIQKEIRGVRNQYAEIRRGKAKGLISKNTKIDGIKSHLNELQTTQNQVYKAQLKEYNRKYDEYIKESAKRLEFEREMAEKGYNYQDIHGNIYDTTIQNPNVAPASFENPRVLQEFKQQSLPYKQRLISGLQETPQYLKEYGASLGKGGHNLLIKPWTKDLPELIQHIKKGNVQRSDFTVSNAQRAFKEDTIKKLKDKDSQNFAFTMGTLGIGKLALKGLQYIPYGLQLGRGAIYTGGAYMGGNAIINPSGQNIGNAILYTSPFVVEKGVQGIKNIVKSNQFYKDLASQRILSNHIEKITPKHHVQTTTRRVGNVQITDTVNTHKISPLTVSKKGNDFAKLAGQGKLTYHKISSSKTLRKTGDFQRPTIHKEELVSSNSKDMPEVTRMIGERTFRNSKGKIIKNEPIEAVHVKKVNGEGAIYHQGKKYPTEFNEVAPDFVQRYGIPQGSTQNIVTGNNGKKFITYTYEPKNPVKGYNKQFKELNYNTRLLGKNTYPQSRSETGKMLQKEKFVYPYKDSPQQKFKQNQEFLGKTFVTDDIITLSKQYKTTSVKNAKAFEKEFNKKYNTHIKAIDDKHIDLESFPKQVQKQLLTDQRIQITTINGKKFVNIDSFKNTPTQSRTQETLQVEKTVSKNTDISTQKRDTTVYT